MNRQRRGFVKLVIVESPTKEKTISKYLGKDYKVMASYGHVRDLAKTGKYNLGVNIDGDFEATYEISPTRYNVINKLKKVAESADEVILATDPDREGEAISWHLCQVLDLDEKTTKRLAFNEITHYGITNALEAPRLLDLDIVQSQETRRIMDRIIGFRLSYLMQQKVKSPSAGRVQSAVLKIIVRRTSGYLSAIQWGLAPDGVARITFPPLEWIFSMISSRKEKSYSPSRGSKVDQEKMPIDISLQFASFINSISRSHTVLSAIHCSGL